MVSAEQQQARGAVGVGLVGQPDIGAEHRLDALAARSGVELDEAEQVAEVGQRQCRHVIPGGTRHRVIDADDAVGDGVLAMQAKMDEARVGHRRQILLLRTSPPETILDLRQECRRRGHGKPAEKRQGRIAVPVARE